MLPTGCPLARSCDSCPRRWRHSHLLTGASPPRVQRAARRTDAQRRGRTALILPLYSAASSSMTGEIMRQGPHPASRHTVSTGGASRLAGEPPYLPPRAPPGRACKPPRGRCSGDGNGSSLRVPGGPGSRTRRPEVHQHRHRRLQHLRLESGVRHRAGCAHGRRRGAMGGQGRRGTGGGCGHVFQDSPPAAHQRAPAHASSPQAQLATHATAAATAPPAHLRPCWLLPPAGARAGKRAAELRGQRPHGRCTSRWARRCVRTAQARCRVPP